MHVEFIHTEIQLYNFIFDNKDDEILIYPIYESNTRSIYDKNNICILLIYNINSKISYCISYSHSECINIKYDISFLYKFKKNKLIVDNKKFRHVIKLENCYDLTSLCQIIDNTLVQIQYTKAHEFIYNNTEIDNLNIYVPISKHIEVFEKLIEDNEQILLKYTIF